MTSTPGHQGGASVSAELSIGQFSQVSRLTIKSLRHYHELELLVPARIDHGSGYRYYRADQLERARVITSLKELGFGLPQITDLLKSCREDGDMVEVLCGRREALARELDRLSARRDQLDALIALARDSAERRIECAREVEALELPGTIFVGQRMQGSFEAMGGLFKAVARVAGRHICDRPMGLFYDEEYREVADFEAGFPVSRRVEVSGEGMRCRELPPARAVVVTHVGPYADSSPAWACAIEAAKEAGFAKLGPAREIYVKGPGMIFRGNPKRYVTRICVTEAS